MKARANLINNYYYYCFRLLFNSTHKCSTRSLKDPIREILDSMLYIFLLVTYIQLLSIPKYCHMGNRKPSKYSSKVSCNTTKHVSSYHHQAGQVHALVAGLAILAVDESAACYSGNKLWASSAHRSHSQQLPDLEGTSVPSADPGYHRHTMTIDKGTNGLQQTR